LDQIQGGFHFPWTLENFGMGKKRWNMLLEHIDDGKKPLLLGPISSSGPIRNFRPWADQSKGG
jgi:hypothetical protein